MFRPLVPFHSPRLTKGRWMAKRSHSSRQVRQHTGAPAAESTVSGRDGVTWAPPAGVPTAGTLTAEAVDLFERGMTSLQRREYRAALSQFEQLQTQFPGEGPLLDRARVYAARCRRALAPPADAAASPVEERLTAATAALNNGDDRTAEQLVASVLDDAKDQDHAKYLLAVIYARRGAAAAAVDSLRLAIEASPEIRVQARHDEDFGPLRGDEAFESLVADPAAHSDTGSER